MTVAHGSFASQFIRSNALDHRVRHTREEVKMIVWREKLIASSLHFLVTLLLAACAAALIFWVWFPDPLQTMLGGWKLFGLVVGCDITLGPLISLVIYNSKKSRRELITDYSIVGLVQIAALAYGVWVVSNSRPVYVVFCKDRLEVITANEIEDADLKAGKTGYTSRPKWGPKLVATAVPDSGEEHNKALFDALAGKDAPVLPRYYTSYESQIDDIKTHAQPLRDLIKRHPEAQEPLARAEHKLGTSPDELRWVPVKHKQGFWTALLDTKTWQPLEYLPVDPY
jgi:hypothetical protein